MAKKESFIMYYDWWEWLNLLSDAQIGQFLRAVYVHELEGKAYSGDDPSVKMATSFAFQALDRNRKKYEETCLKRSEAGKKGGAKGGNQNARKQPNARSVEQRQAKQANARFVKQQQAKQANARFVKQQQAKQPDNDQEQEQEHEPDSENEHEREYDCEYDSPNGATTPETTEPESTETVSLELSGVVAQLKPYCRSQDWGKNSTLRVQRWLESGAEPEMLVYAFDVALDYGAENVFGYASAIIDRWLSKNIRTKNEAIECDREWNELDSETRKILTSNHRRTFFPNNEESSEIPF